MEDWSSSTPRTILQAVGVDAAGLKIDGTTVPFGTMDGLTVNIVGDPTSTEDALGVWATNQVSGVASVVNVDHLTVTGVSPRSLGLFTIASTINATNSNITVNGAGGVGAAAALNGGTINLTNSTLILNGDGAGAVRARNQFGESAINIFTASGGSITSLQSPAFIAQGGLLDATLSNGVRVTGNGLLVSAVTGPLTPGDPSTDAPSTINLVGTTGAILNGDAFAEPLNIVNISLVSGAKWNGAALNVTNVNVGADSTWSMTADSTVTQTVTNAGLIQFGDFMTLTTQNYAGLGGTLGLNTYLGSDGSPSDRLVISGGSATGNTIVRVTNAGGPGAETTGDGIQVVSAINGAMTSASAFSLPAGELRAGAFDYDLFRGGAGGSRPNDWFLRSDFVAPPVAAAGHAPRCVCRSRHSPLTRRRTRCRPTSAFRSSGPNSPPMGWCSPWRANWGSASSARSTTGSAILTSRMVAPFSLRSRPRLSICRPGSQWICRPGRGRR